MSERYESRNPLPTIIAVYMGFQIGHAVSAILDRANDRVRDVQIHNEQVYHQLSGTHVVNGLILNDKNNTFGFHNEAEGACAGKFEVKNDAATVVGPLACTQTVPLPTHS